jgi:hypothetical protein
MRRTLVPLLAIALLALLATPIAAKEWHEARFDAPIAMGTPGGTEILVGITVTSMSGADLVPVEGTPIYLQLTGRFGDTTRAAAATDRIPGHYTVRIAIPAGGARGAEVGIQGTVDMPMMLMNEPFVFGPISARTAQLAPSLDTTTVAQPTAAVAVAPDPAQVPLAAPDAPAGPVATVHEVPIVAALLAIAVGALAVAVVARRRPAADPTPGSA